MQVIKKFIPIKHAAKKIGVSRARIYGLIKADKNFPKPIKLGKSTVFYENEVELWMEEKAHSSRGLNFDPVSANAAKRGRKPKKIAQEVPQ